MGASGGSRPLSGVALRRVLFQMNQSIITMVKQLGAVNVSFVPVNQIVFHRAFRHACEANTCGNFGKCFMCPPDIGDIDLLIASVKRYQCAVVYQTIHLLEDSYDFEGMIKAWKKHQELSQQVNQRLRGETFLHLAAGGCGYCEVCAKGHDDRCRFPEHALSSLEAYGVDVSELATLAQMKYINGANTVTYFGAIFFP